MECDDHDISKNTRKTSILESNGFECHLIHRNCMCKHESYVPRASPNPTPVENLNLFESWKEYISRDT